MNVKLLYFLTACLLLALGACDSLIYDDREGSHETDEGPVVYLSITKAQAAGLESLNADAADYEDRVHDLALLVFDSGTGVKVGEYFDENIPFGVKEKSFTVKLTPGTRDFYFVANMPMTELKAIGSKGAMLTYMQSFRNLDAGLYLGATESRGFPMSRVYLAQVVTEGGNIYAPMPFRPNGEDRVNLIRTVAKLEVVIEGGATGAGVQNIYYKNAFRQFGFTEGAYPASVSYYEDKPLKKVGDSYIYYMPETMINAVSWSAAADHKPVNYFRIEMAGGIAYDIPIITDNRVITDTNYMTFATGKNPADLPDYSLYRNRHYFYLIKNLQKIEIMYSVDPWNVTKSQTFMGYGYNVNVGDDGKVRVSNTVNVCAPHTVKLATVAPFTFSDGTTQKVFTSLGTTDFVEYTLNPVPKTGDGAYLKVWYNDGGSDAPVKTFSK
ncbi:MAG TPA: FimB/Mfa2 family fimbrial subunit [Macellibacteroides fermentans]|uniref:FimB/Mfa2 family fimbrial subunit n=1 Tax=Macellibacteroides fermentans TaxID=879969 RepID=UPI002D110C9B|nr:FimB/Mfa2 family fimbrial subunit [Macellibacteroides fermentans]